MSGIDSCNSSCFIEVYFSKILCLIIHLNLQASEDAKKLVDEERAFARAEIESARAAVQKVESVLQEQERGSRAVGKQVDALCVFKNASFLIF